MAECDMPFIVDSRLQLNASSLEVVARVNSRYCQGNNGGSMGKTLKMGIMGILGILHKY